MRKTTSQKIQLGVFMILGTALFVVAIYFIGQRKNLFTPNYTIKAYFQNVNGLQSGNNVRFSGVNIGIVSEIVMANDSTIEVQMLIEKQMAEYLKKNAIATIGSDGLVGNMIVNIVPGDGPSTRVENNDIIKTYSKIGADDILSTLSATNENAAILTADLLKITRAMLEGKGTLGLLLHDTIMARDLKESIKALKLASLTAASTIRELESVSTSFHNPNSVAGTLLNDSLSGAKIKNMIIHLETSSKSLEASTNEINHMLEQLQNDQGAMHYLTQDSTLVSDLKSTVKHLNDGTAKFDENMRALQSHFLFRRYFKKQEKEAKKK